MQKIRFAPLGALALGLIGALLRHRELVSAFDPATGLTEPGAGLALGIFTGAVLIAAAALAVLISRGLDAPDGFTRAFRNGSYVFFAVMALAGVTLLICAVFAAAAGVEILNLAGISRWVFILVLALGGFGMAGMAWSGYTQRESPFVRLGTMMPALLFCYWLVAYYRANAGNPVLLEYCYMCLGLAAAACCAYYSAGYAFGRKKVGWTVFTGLAASYLLPIAALSPAHLALRLPLAVSAVYFSVSTVTFLSSLTERLPEAPGEESR